MSEPRNSLIGNVNFDPEKGTWFSESRFVRMEGVDFETCYEVRVVVEIDDVTVNFIDLENLKQNKKATGRLQDLADLENLQ